ncbi:MAG: YunC family protein [Methanothrix sp.]
MEETMISEELEYGGGVAKGYVIPIGPAKIVFAVGAKGMVGCGAFDVQALERFGYPAARVRPAGGGPVESLEDLLEGEVKDANGPAAALGVEVGMRGRDALELL